MVLWPTNPWKGDEGALTARLSLAVPTARVLRGGGRQVGHPLEAAWLAVMLRPLLEGRGLFLGAPLRTRPKVGAVAPLTTWLFLVLEPVVTLMVLR